MFAKLLRKIEKKIKNALHRARDAELTLDILKGENPKPVKLGPVGSDGEIQCDGSPRPGGSTIGRGPEKCHFNSKF
jgi:hypothetical protein